MKITYNRHSSFLVETGSCYYLFDYEKGPLPEMELTKPVLVFASHGHHDHYQPEIFSKLKDYGMKNIYGVLSDDIEMPDHSPVLQVTGGEMYSLWFGQKLVTFQSTDLGVAFLIEDGNQLIYHAGDLNDWVWEEESAQYNAQMTLDYRKQIQLLAKTLDQRKIDAAFVVLDPRQEKDYDRGLCYFLEHIPVEQVYPMHDWETPEIVDAFLKDHPKYAGRLLR